MHGLCATLSSVANNRQLDKSHAGMRLSARVLNLLERMVTLRDATFIDLCLGMVGRMSGRMVREKYALKRCIRFFRELPGTLKRAPVWILVPKFMDSIRNAMSNYIHIII